MTSEEKEMVNRYITTFKNKIASILKDDVSIKSTVFPYPDGAILIFSFGFKGVGNTEYKSEADNLHDASEKASVRIPDVPNKCKIIFEGNKIIEIKPFEKVAWSSFIADDVIKHIYDAMLEINQDS